MKKITADRKDIRLSAVPPCKGDAMMAGRSAARQVAESLRIPCIEKPLGEYGPNEQEKVTKIALAISLDDIAQGMLGEFLFGNVNRLVQPGSAVKSLLPVICPFITVPSDELDLSWEIGGTGFNLPRDTPDQGNTETETGTVLKNYSRRHPATKYALLHLAEQLSSGNAAETAVAGAVGPGTGQKKTSSPQERPNS
jgi:tRNA(Ile)-lysidine synthase TilS/MesJ